MHTNFLSLIGATSTLVFLATPASAFTVGAGFTGYDILIDTGADDFTISGMFSATNDAFLDDDQLGSEELGDWMFDVSGPNGGFASFSKSAGHQISFFITFSPSLPSPKFQLLVQAPPTNLQVFSDSHRFDLSGFTGPEGIDFADFEPSFLLTQKTPTEPVPEPLTILGTVTALGLGVVMKQKFS